MNNGGGGVSVHHQCLIPLASLAATVISGFAGWTIPQHKPQVTRSQVPALYLCLPEFLCGGSIPTFSLLQWFQVRSTHNELWHEAGTATRQVCALSFSCASDGFLMQIICWSLHEPTFALATEDIFRPWVLGLFMNTHYFLIMMV